MMTTGMKLIGANPHEGHGRGHKDFYATDPRAIDALVASNNSPTSKNVWECACGQGHLSKRLEEYGYTVKSTDLIDRGYGKGGVDFFTAGKLADCIITNPPFNLALDFAYHALENIMVDELYLFLKLIFLESEKRREFFEKYPPEKVLVFSKRIGTAMNGDPKYFQASPAMCYAWFVWRKDAMDGKPVIEWI